MPACIKAGTCWHLRHHSMATGTAPGLKRWRYQHRNQSRRVWPTWDSSGTAALIYGSVALPLQRTVTAATSVCLHRHSGLPTSTPPAKPQCQPHFRHKPTITTVATGRLYRDPRPDRRRPARRRPRGRPCPRGCQRVHGRHGAGLVIADTLTALGIYIAVAAVLGGLAWHLQ